MTKDTSNLNSIRLTFLHAFQWLLVNLVICLVLPLVIAPHLGLDDEGLRQLTQRTFFYSGIATLIQALWGHRMPIFESPSTLWVGAAVALSANAHIIGKPLSLLRGEIALGFIIGGILYLIVAALRLMNHLTKLFTPAVMGTFFVLVVIQIAKSLSSSFITFTNGSVQLYWLNIAVAILTISTVQLITIYGRGSLRCFSLLSGVVAGWLAYIALTSITGNEYGGPDFSNLAALEPPVWLAWGSLSIDPLVLGTSLVIAFMAFANLIATVKGMALELNNDKVNMDHAVMMTGIANILGGVGGTIGYVSGSHSIGFVSITRNSSRNPIILQSFFLMILGLIPAVGAFFSSMPAAAGQAIFLVILYSMFSLGVSYFKTMPPGRRKMLVLGIPLLIGIVLIFLPARLIIELPVILAGIAGNGLVAGLILSVILDNLI